MIGMLITGHGNFASGVTSSLQLIAGNMENVVSVDFKEGESTAQLKEHLNEGFDKLKKYDGVLVFSDIAGGSPFKNAVECKVERKDQKVEVLSGTNLPMLIEAYTGASSCDNLATFAEKVACVAREQVMRFEWFEHEDDIPEDGI